MRHSRHERGAHDRPSVAVTITLRHPALASGHVKCWERFAEAAARHDTGVDLTVYFLGSARRSVRLAEHVRYELLTPLLSTDRAALLRQQAGETDLAPHHPALARLLRRHDLLHVTDPFSFGRTALRVAAAGGRPVVSSVHTDFPCFTRVYTRNIVTRVLGEGTLGRLALERLRVADRAAASMQRRVERLLAASRLVLVPNPDSGRWAAQVVGERRVRHLRRGIDRARFRPDGRDREALTRRFAIPPGRCVVLVVGRVDDSKNAMVAARAVRRLVDAGRTPHLLVVGEGSDRPRVAAELGDAATCPGALPQEELPAVYAASDVLLFPSWTDTFGNVILEAMASGLPVVVAAGTKGAELVGASGEAGVVVDGFEPAAWAEALGALLDDADLRARMGRAASQRVARWPDWDEVLREDLLPAWREVLDGREELATGGP